MKIGFGLLALATLAGTAAASTSVVLPFTIQASVTFTNKASIDAVNDLDNARDTWVSTYTGSVTGVRVTGSLTRNQTGTFASEARVRVGAAFGTRDLQASTLASYTGTIAIGPTTLNPAAFNLTAGETVNFQWFESAQDGTANLAESTWNTVTYEFGSGGNTVVTNGNFNAGALSFGQTYTHAGSHVSGGLDFFAFSIPAVGNPGEELKITTSAGPATSMTDTEIALYDAAGNKIAENDDISPTNFFSQISQLTAAGGNYTLVTGGFNTIFPTTLSGTFTPGTNAGNYGLTIELIPAPGALALAGLGGLVAARRRRA